MPARTVPITQADIEAYERDGAVCVRGAFCAEWINGLARGVEQELENPGPLAKIYTAKGASGRFFGDFDMWRRIPEFADFVRQSPAAEMAAAFMKSRSAVFYHDHLLIKEPDTKERTPWHHDQPYYPIDGRQICSIWLPLDSVARETCVEFVKGSHNWRKWFTPRYFIDGSSYYDGADDGFEPCPDFDARRDEFEFLSWSVDPGDCIVFHALTVHGAPGNLSARHRRRAYATRWLGDDARFAARRGRVSPPIDDHGLEPGDRMASERFPVIWQRT